MSRLAIPAHPIASWLIVAIALFAGFAGAQALPDAPEAAQPCRGAAGQCAEELWRGARGLERSRGHRALRRCDVRLRSLARARARRARGRAHAFDPRSIAPEALYAKPEGVCIDLARFGVETLNRLDASFAARYLMLEFEPVVIDGRTLRRHWVASFRRDGKLWFFADSRRPGAHRRALRLGRCIHRRLRALPRAADRDVARDRHVPAQDAGRGARVDRHEGR